MKKTWIVIIVIVAIVLALGGWVSGKYNGLVEKEERWKLLGRRLKMCINAVPT